MSDTSLLHHRLIRPLLEFLGTFVEEVAAEGNKAERVPEHGLQKGVVQASPDMTSDHAGKNEANTNMANTNHK